MTKRNPWRFEEETLCLILDPIPEEGVHEYGVDLERCTTSAEVLDKIIQVAEKGWVPDSVLAGLVHKLNEVLCLQATLCGFGREMGPIDIPKALKNVRNLMN